jgi:hypothetical protein
LNVAVMRAKTHAADAQWNTKRLEEMERCPIISIAFYFPELFH